MSRSANKMVMGVLAAALLMPIGHIVASAPSGAAVADVSASTAAGPVAPTARKAMKNRKKTKVRCTIVKKRVGKKIKRVKKCKKVVTKKKAVVTSATALATIAPPAVTRVPGGLPSAANTGVPAGTALTVQTGNLTITTPGTVIDGKDIRGYVVVKAPNVTIKRSIIRGGEAATSNRPLLAITQAGASNFLVEDVTVTPMNPTPYVNGINMNQSGTIRRANISGTVDGIMIYGDGVRVGILYFHDFVHYLNDPNWGGGPSHDDAIQVQAGTGVQIVGNTLTGAFNAAVMVNQDAGTTKDLAINSNWLDYGGCSINYASNGLYKTGMQANNNRFGRAQRVSGCAIIHNSTKSDLVPTGNVWDDNGQPVTPSRGK